MRRFGVFLLALVALLLVPSPAHAQTGERITRFTFDAVVQGDGDMLVTETIEYDFGSNERHGIFRDIPTRLTYDDDNDRVYPLSDVGVSSSDASDQVSIEDGTDGTTRLRIGDPDQTISGVRHYEITYRLGGAVNAFDDHVELYWNAIGAGWTIPIDNATATVSAPAPITEVACFAGPAQSSAPCDGASVDGSRARFTHASLQPFEALTFVVAAPPGAITATGPILEERWSIDDSFSVDTGPLAALVTVLGLVLAGVGALVWRVGRDRRTVGSAIDVAYADGDTHERVPLFGRDETPVEFEPPDKLRPGQIGTLIDERANALDVTATIVDLAVRGYLRIEEIPKDGWFDKIDWRLVRLKEADDALLAYERSLMTGLFESGVEVELSDLKNTFATRLKKVQRHLYEDALHNKWFSGSPDKIRARWIGIGVGVLLLGIALTIGVAIISRYGLVPLPIILGGLLLMILSGRMPNRTPTGTGALVRTLGFRRFIMESEQDRAQFAERQHLFTEYLPYAIVFGATEKWAKAFAGLDGELPDQSSWYVSNHAFTYLAFSSSMNSFSTSSAGTIASTPSSSGTSGFGGGGFSGGGGGGGGGGSW